LSTHTHLRERKKEKNDQVLRNTALRQFAII